MAYGQTAERRITLLQDVIRRIDPVPGVLATCVNAGMPPVYNWALTDENPGNTLPDGNRTLLPQVNESCTKD